MGARRPTLADVAELAGVDKAVVSKVLSGDPGLRVREETRQRVLDAIDRLGYRRNAIARSLRTARAGAIGLVIPDFANPVYTSIIEGAAAGAAARSSFLLTASVDTLGYTGESPIDLLRDGRVDGLLLAGEIGDIDGHRLAGQRLRCVSVNRRISGFDRYVILDDHRAAALATSHLVELGHRRIGLIAGPANVGTAWRRRDGYLAAMENAGLEVPEEYIASGEYTAEGGSRALGSLLGVEPRPTAIVASNIAAGIGAIGAAWEAAVPIPEELSVVAIHDISIAEHTTPPLTTVAMPLEEMARVAVELLMTHDVGERIERVVEEPMRIVERASTRGYETTPQ